MPNSLTANGLTLATRAEWVTFFTAAYQQIYGADINLDSDTPDGQWMNLVIQTILDLQDLTSTVYNGFDPDNAIGNVLDQRIAINGIERQAGTFTTTDVTITVNQSVNIYGLDQTIQPVFTVADSAGNQWQLVATELGLTIGAHSLLFQAADPGQVLTVPNTIVIPVTIVLGVTAINNPNTYLTLGVNEESDATVKIRRRKSVSLQTQGFLQGLEAALENIPGITSALVFENDSSTTDSNGVPGHSIWVVVDGASNIPLALAYNSGTTYSYGDIASSAGQNYVSVANSNTGNSVSNPDFWQTYNPIAWAIYNYRNAGCGMYNSMDAVSESETLRQIDGTDFTVYWDGVIPANLYVKFTAKILNGLNPPNIAALTTALETGMIQPVNGEANINQVAAIVAATDPNTIASSIGVSAIDTGPFTNVSVPNQVNEQYVNIFPIILPIILAAPNCGFTFTFSGGEYTLSTVTASVAASGGTIQFAAIGGFGTYTYSVLSGAGSINASTGLYTSAGAGTDVIHVVDGQSNVGTATVTVT